MTHAGTHVPLIASWKGVTPAGRVHSAPVDLTDIFPTIAEVAGVKLPAGTILDGRSFAPVLRGEPGFQQRAHQRASSRQARATDARPSPLRRSGRPAAAQDPRAGARGASRGRGARRAPRGGGEDAS